MQLIDHKVGGYFILFFPFFFFFPAEWNFKLFLLLMGFSEPHKVLMAMALYLLLFEGEADKGKLQLAAAEGALLNTACCCCLGSEGAKLSREHRA